MTDSHPVIDPPGSHPPGAGPADRFTLAQMLPHRSVPLAGMFVVVTEKCPLRCAHCSTESLMRSPDGQTDLLMRFLSGSRPPAGLRFLLLTGGEPLLYPGRVQQIADSVRDAGLRVGVLTGLYFASRRAGAPPPPVARALHLVGHVTVSMDAYHEAQVPHENVLAFLDWGLDAGLTLSVQLTRAGNRDEYATRVESDVARRFGASVEIFSSHLRAVGRAADLPAQATGRRVGSPEPRPCAMLSWPVVRADGQVVRCCSYEATMSPTPPEHLLAGHLRDLTWASLAASYDTPIVRAIRLAGPEYLNHRVLRQPEHEGGYCGCCATHSHAAVDVARARELVDSPWMQASLALLGTPQLEGATP